MNYSEWGNGILILDYKSAVSNDHADPQFNINRSAFLKRIFLLWCWFWSGCWCWCGSWCWDVDVDVDVNVAVVDVNVDVDVDIDGCWSWYGCC